MDTTISAQDACYKPVAFVIVPINFSTVGPGMLRLGDAEVSAQLSCL